MVFGDGRTAIQGSGKRYDLILSEPSNPWLAGVSNLFTREHFRAAREHLRAGGLLAQWMQTYQFTASDYAMILRTLRSEFDHVGVLTFSGGADTLLLASDGPIAPDPAGLDRIQQTVDETPGIRTDLERWFGTSDVRQLLLLHYVLGEDQLASLMKQDPSGRTNTDLHLQLEFDAPLHLFREIPRDENATLAVLGAVRSDWVGALATRMGLPPGSAEELAARGQHALDLALHAGPQARSTGLDEAASQFEAAIAARPDLVYPQRGLAHVRREQGRRGEAAEALARVVALAPDDALTQATLAEELLRLRRPDQAVTHFRAALALRPELSSADTNVMWANNLAWVLATSPDAALRNGTEAVVWATRASEAVGGQNPAVLDTLAAAFAEAGRFDDAIAVARRMEVLAGDEPKATREAKARIASFQASQPVRAD
jgi:spermidine synthase